MTLSKFTELELLELKKEFKGLTSVRDKYKFWQEKLNFPYYFTYTLNHSDIFDFYFEGKTPEEIEILNELILEEVRLKGTLKIVDSEKLESDLLTKLSEAVKPFPLLEEELKRVKSIVEKQEQKAAKTNILNAEEYSQSNFFLNGYREYYLKGKEVSLSTQNYSTPNLISLINGCEIAKYQTFIEGKIKNPVGKSLANEHAETSLKQQILILHYLGLLESFETSTNKNKSHIISKLLNRSETKVKAALTYLGHNSDHNPITVSNLEIVVRLLEKTGFENAVAKAKNDLTKAKERKK
ncbi:hypothetical protein [Rubrolithibacter danxiaensis]|uniref:hypothetical protein n=1 Tax=Rubrolithibacter danxiaensis TaxID=3390805 RepID=UPI003BF77665